MFLSCLVNVTELEWICPRYQNQNKENKWKSILFYNRTKGREKLHVQKQGLQNNALGQAYFLSQCQPHKNWQQKYISFGVCWQCTPHATES